MTAAVVQPQAPARLLFGGNLQAFPPPDALHSIFAHLPSGLLQQRRDSAITEAAILAGQRQDRLRQPILVFRLASVDSAASSAIGPSQPAGMPFTEAFVPGVLNGETSPRGT